MESGGPNDAHYDAVGDGGRYLIARSFVWHKLVLDRVGDASDHEQYQEDCRDYRVECFHVSILPCWNYFVKPIANYFQMRYTLGMEATR